MQRDCFLRASAALSISTIIVVLAGTWGMTQTTSPRVAAQPKTDPKINEPFMKPDLKAFIKRFESNDREPYAKRREIVSALELRRGMSVADLGAGTGFFTRLFSEKVGESGKVYAIDIAPQFLNHIAAESKRLGQTNVVTVRGDQDEIKLPQAPVDLIFLSDVYHHLEKPEKALASMHRALRAEGSLVVIDFDKVEGQSTDFVLKHVRASKNVFRKEIEMAGFQEMRVVKPPALKENFFLRFQKAATPARVREKIRTLPR
jgi:ubiquinone/menaquinone biosynthesis C-methylase UbiE